MSLNEKEMMALSSIASKLKQEGYDVSDIETILTAERGNINAQLVIDLTNYFPIKDKISVSLAGIEYGYEKLRLSINATVQRVNGVFDKNSRPPQFESVLGNAIADCLKNLKEEYQSEVDALIPVVPQPSTVVTASDTNPIILTVGSNVLNVVVGTIDKAKNWNITKIEDSTGTSLDGTGTTTTATALAPISIELDDGNGTTITFSAVSGSWDGSSISGANVIISGGI